MTMTSGLSRGKEQKIKILMQRHDVWAGPSTATGLSSSSDQRANPPCGQMVGFADIFVGFWLFILSARYYVRFSAYLCAATFLGPVNI